MLAKELKIKALVRQKEFIKRQLEKVLTYSGVDPSFRYMGYMYPEVKEYLEEEGFQVSLLDPYLVSEQNRIKPNYLIIPKDDIRLSESELALSEKYKDLPTYYRGSQEF